jgi:hypothetical protein
LPLNSRIVPSVLVLTTPTIKPPVVGGLLLLDELIATEAVVPLGLLDDPSG